MTSWVCLKMLCIPPTHGSLIGKTITGWKGPAEFSSKTVGTSKLIIINRWSNPELAVSGHLSHRLILEFETSK